MLYVLRTQPTRTLFLFCWGDAQDIEFTIQDKKLFLLQCRAGKRTGQVLSLLALLVQKHKY
jgi:hypothetical protein